MRRIGVAIAIVYFAALAGHALGQAPSKDEQAAALDAIREYALSYTKNLPNYTCTQTTRETISVAAGQVQRPPDVIEEQISFTDKKELRKVVKINGSNASPEGRDQRANASSRGEFGNLLDIVFEPATGADIRFDRLSTLNRRRLYVFAFRVPQSSGYMFTESKRRIQVPFRGSVYADYETNAVVRIEMKCTGIPRGSEYTNADLTLDYKPAMVAGHEFILPAHYLLHFRMIKGSQTNEPEYTAYRKFSADAAVKFEGDKQ